MRNSLIKDIMKIMLSLIIIAGVAGALLGLVNYYTQITDDELMAKKAGEVYEGKLVTYSLPQGVNPSFQFEGGSVLNVYESTAENQDVYVFRAEGEGAYGGTLQLLINITDGRIVKIAKYSASETPGLGSKALQDNYFSKYYGIELTSIEGFELVKISATEDGEIAAVSGATKSSTAVANAVNAAVAWYKQFIAGGEE